MYFPLPQAGLFLEVIREVERRLSPLWIPDHLISYLKILFSSGEFNELNYVILLWVTNKNYWEGFTVSHEWNLMNHYLGCLKAPSCLDMSDVITNNYTLLKTNANLVTIEILDHTGPNLKGFLRTLLCWCKCKDCRMGQVQLCDCLCFRCNLECWSAGVKVQRRGGC